jgi:RNA-binding protein Luc7-like 2
MWGLIWLGSSLQKQEKEALKRSEESAEMGNVDASMTFANEAEGLSKQQAELYKQFTTPDRTMSVCDV